MPFCRGLMARPDIVTIHMSVIASFSLCSEFFHCIDKNYDFL